jgi:formamidopyrimidine-DNA glycosylase
VKRSNMPELPEVETIKNELTPYVVGRKITDITLLWEKIVKKPSAKEFLAHVAGQKIVDLSRRGKYLLFKLGSGEMLIMHMKMTGSLLIDTDDDKYSRAIIKLDDGIKISFRDPRKFGAMWWSKDGSDVLPKLGPEPLEDGFTAAVLAQRLHNKAAPIKAVLLDQSVLAGVGNMYADEALFDVKIHPERTAGSLSAAEIKRLYTAIRRILTAAIGNKGASVRNYYRPGGELGTAHFEFRVAHGLGKKCPRDGTPIARIRVRGRGTYFCPKCQRIA